MAKPFRVAERVYLVGDSDVSHPYDCCVYLIDGGELLLIDAGAGRSYDRIVSNIESLGFDLARLKTVLATHGHIDHIGALHEFRDRLGAKIVAHELDSDAIEKGHGTAAEVYRVRYVPCPVDVRLQGSESMLEVGDLVVNVVHIPGHTPGSIAAYIDVGGKRVLFGQDIHGPYYIEWGADPAAARQSLLRLMELGADVLCEGHFGIYEPASAVERYIMQYVNSL